MVPGYVVDSRMTSCPVRNPPATASDAEMMYETSGPYALPEDPPVWREYRTALSDAQVDVDLEPIEKWEFYKAVKTPDLVLTVQTADMQRFANLLLTIGVVMP